MPYSRAEITFDPQNMFLDRESLPRLRRSMGRSYPYQALPRLATLFHAALGSGAPCISLRRGFVNELLTQDTRVCRLKASGLQQNDRKIRD